MELSQLLQEGYEIDFYDAKHDTSSGLKVFEIGRFAVTLLDDEMVYITYRKLLNI